MSGLTRQDRVDKPLTVKSKALLRPAHIKANRTIRAGPNLKLPLIIPAPSVDVRLHLVDVRTERYNLVALKQGADNRIHILARNQAVGHLLRVPRPKEEYSTVADATS